MKDIFINNYNFKINLSGSGEQIIFVHGSVSDFRTWTVIERELSKHYCTLSYSRRYHWPNKQINEDQDYSIFEHMEDLKELILSQKDAPVHLVGHSYGAFICLLLAIHDPALISTLVLSEPPAITLFVSFPPRLQELLKLLFTEPPTALAILKFGIFGVAPAEKAIKNDQIDKTIELFGKATLGYEYYKLLTEDRLMQVQQNLIKAEFLGSGYPKLDINKIKMINTPTLLITGENSPSLFYYIVRRLIELLPEAEWMKIPNASHIAHEDNPNFYSRSIISFLHKHSGTH